MAVIDQTIIWLAGLWLCGFGWLSYFFENAQKDEPKHFIAAAFWPAALIFYIFVSGGKKCSQKNRRR